MRKTRLAKRFWAPALTILAALSQASAAGEAKMKSEYGKVTRFKKGEAIEFPNFSIAYQGAESSKSDAWPRPFVYQVFEVLGPKDEFIVRPAPERAQK